MGKNQQTTASKFINTLALKNADFKVVKTQPGSSKERSAVHKGTSSIKNSTQGTLQLKASVQGADTVKLRSSSNRDSR